MSSRTRAGWVSSLAGPLGLLGGLTLVRPAHADLPARPLIEAARRDVGLSRIFDVGVERWLVRVPNEQAARAAGLVPVSPSWAVARGTAESMLELERRATDFEVRWSPGLRPLLDQAGETVRAVEVHDDLGLSGQGVIVGVIDTGADLTHSALRRADGTTRVAWLLSFDLGPQGLHPELEEAYGCVEDDSCGILNAADIDEILAGGLPGPRDRVGHGTHVTSTAAGSAGIYGGMAPESEVVIVQSGSSTGSLRDPDILLGARFIYDRAAEEAKPAVINISLGSSFGAHDGGSSLEDGLAELAQGPGRLMVVAGGNDGSLYDSGSSDYPAPFGVHSEVTVPVDGQVRVSLLTPESQRDLVQGSMYLWIGLEQDDEMSVRFDTLRGGITSPVGPGQAAGFTSQGLHEQGDTDYELSIFNGQDGDDGSDYVRPGNVALVLTGAWEPGRVFELVLSGRGAARIWLSSSGQVGPEGTGTGMLMPRARIGGTVGIPASHPDLIAVGSSVNRNSWRDYEGRLVERSSLEVGTRSSFSSAGPNLRGWAKPDLLAPGGTLIAAMSAAADPRDTSNTASMFAARGVCYSPDVECFVVDDEHAVASGTSMAAPIVSGALALLLQRDPTLEQAKARRLLRAGTRAVLGETAYGAWTGTGVLDVVGTLLAQDLDAGAPEVLPSAAESRIALADTFAVPSGERPLRGVLALRDESGAPAGGFDAKRLRFEVVGGVMRGLEVTSGLAAFELRADEGSGGELTVRAFFDDEALAEQSVPVGMDPLRARLGVEALGGGCSLAAAGPGWSGVGWARMGGTGRGGAGPGGAGRAAGSGWLLFGGLIALGCWVRRRARA